MEVVEQTSKDAFAAYYCVDNQSVERDIVYNSDLGLAMEALPEGVTVQQLWTVM